MADMYGEDAANGYSDVKRQSLFKGPAVLKSTFDPYSTLNDNGVKTRNEPLPPVPAWEIKRRAKLYGGK